MKNLNIVILLFGILFSLLTGCKKEELKNPFDPEFNKALWTPTNFQVVQEGEVLKLTWVQSEENISGFKLERKVGEGTYSAITTLGKTVTSWVDNDVTGGQLHSYQLYAYAGDNTSNIVTAFKTPLFEAAAVVLPATEINYNSAVLNGEVNPNGSSTTVTFKYKKTSATAWETVPADQGTLNGNNTQEVSAEITDLNHNTVYEYKVVAFNDAGTFESENAESFRTGAAVINITPATQEVSSDAGGVTFNVDSNVPWELEDAAGWTTLTKVNETTFRVSYSSNVSANSRTAAIRVYFDDVEKIVTLTQSVEGTKHLVVHESIIKNNIDINNLTTLGQVSINPSVSGKVIVRFNGYCISDYGDRILLAASNTPNWGANNGHVQMKSTPSSPLHIVGNPRLGNNSFSHTRVYDINAGNYTYYAVAVVSNVAGQSEGNGIVSVYGNLTVQFIPNSLTFINHIDINKYNIDVNNSTTVGQVSINPTVSGKVIVRFDGYCRSDYGDRIILAASNTPNWGANEGHVEVEAYSTEIDQDPFSHTQVYNVSAGSHTFYAIAHNYVETDGDGIASIYGRLTVEFVADSKGIIGHMGVIKTGISAINETNLGQVTINPAVPGKAIVHFDGYSYCPRGGNLLIYNYHLNLSASDTPSVGTDNGKVVIHARNADIIKRNFSHTQVYNVAPGSKTFYAVGQCSNGTISTYGTLTVLFVPD
ncbi:BACON domain-containing protein [Saccharicrinis sp. 156]|uniref:BACON domain-containing protein n=1 Tax=Saccharicrinis sp. 156 TaxID=3417574 RepID=UPI003D34F351